MPYKIVYYIDCDHFGGAEQVLYTLLRGLDRDMWDPVLAYHPSPGIATFISSVEQLGIDTFQTSRIAGYRDIKGIREFSSKLKLLKPRVFHANINWPISCSGGIIAAFTARIHTIIGTQHLYEKIESRRLCVFHFLISLLVNRYIAVSADLAKELRQAVPAFKIQIVQNGIDFDRFRVQSIGKANDVYAPFRKKNLPVALTVARLVKQKGHTYLLKAAAKIPDAVFVFAGDGPERSNLENEANALNISDRVVFLGERTDIPELLAGCDLYVLPSIFEGGVAISIMEAMAAGKPVIATEVEGVKKNLTNGVNAVLAPPADEAALTEAIKSLISNSAAAKKIAAEGKSLAYREFSSDRMVKDVTEIYNRYL
jgi:glycosyltransferase involved in cell wall biosynthesis